MATNTEQISSDSEILCVVCFKNVEIYSFGICDHPVCFECSTRMRVLCRQNECPICRAHMPKVIFTKKIQSFAQLYPILQYNSRQDKNYGLIFDSADIQKFYQKLLEHRCQICAERKFYTFQQLKDHMRREHNLSYCDLCVENLKIFTCERRCYTRQELGYHRRKGDPDNTSHRGHPLCEFCDNRFMDTDDLFRHLRREHLFCHLCDADGKHQYYNAMEDLKRHFLDEHYLCEEGECKSMPLISVFRSNIDLKAHIATKHGKYMTKSATKQARTLELEFTLLPRNRNRLINEYEGAVGFDSRPINCESLFDNQIGIHNFQSLDNSTITSVNPFNGEDFPSLGSTNKIAQEMTITKTYKDQTEANLEKTNENFPYLVTNPNSSTVRLSVNKKSPKVSIHVNNQNGAITTHITTTTTTAATAAAGGATNNSINKLDDAFPALVPNTTIIEQPQWVPKKNLKSPTNQQNKVAPAPQLPPSDLSQFPTLKSKKKTSTLTLPISNNSNNKSKKKNNNNSNNNTNNTNNNNNSDTLNKNNLKVSELKIGNLSLNNNDNIKTISKPPPGFPIKPPPGLNNNNNNKDNNNNNNGDNNKLPANLCGNNDLTFTNSNGESYSIIPSTSKLINYYQPINFTKRNQNLIKEFMAVLNNDLIREFKNYSDLFRNNTITTNNYYEHCKIVMGEKFDELFPELLVLLPDINKQQQLFKLYYGINRKNLIQCEQCKQILFVNELNEHSFYHNFDNQFPHLNGNKSYK